jgi:hypothetical protein
LQLSFTNKDPLLLVRIKIQCLNCDDQAKVPQTIHVFLISIQQIFSYHTYYP